MVCKRLCAGRVSVPGQIHLVTCATYRRQPLFAEFAAARLVIIEMRRLHDSGLIASLAWVLMPDHWHGLIELRGDSCLSTSVGDCKGRTARALRISHPWLGPIWCPGFHDRAMRRSDELKAAARYLLNNPVRAGLVQRIGEYPFWDAIWL